MREIGRSHLLAPALVLDLDPEKGCAPVALSDYKSLFVVERVNGLPHRLSFWAIEQEDEVDPSTLALPRPVAGQSPAPTEVVPSTLGLTVAICTRDRPTQLRRALVSLCSQSDDAFQTIVVDNAPDNPDTFNVVKEFADYSVTYVLEERPGLSHARNRALSIVGTELIAWLDDDEVADRDWVHRIKQGFVHPSSPAAVCGLMLPAVLETEAQVRFEQYGGFNKGRGLQPEVLKARSATILSPLYPLPSFGSGGNMAFRVDSLLAIGAFDPYLGPGTRTRNGEETQVLALLLQADEAILHWPAAVTWHYHRRQIQELREQIFGYSAGLSAFYASMIWRNPLQIRELLLVSYRLLRRALGRTGRSGAPPLPADFPRVLVWARYRGFLEGGFRYIGSRLVGPRLSK